MKKRFLFPFVLLFLGSITIFGQSEEYMRWSVQVKGGISALRANYDHEKGKFARDYSPEFGVEVERTFNPLIGLSLEYMYQTIMTDEYQSRVNQMNIVLPMNISNLFSPTREWNLFNFYFNPGLGFGVGGYDSFEYNGMDYNDVSSKIALSMTLGIGMEYNITNSLAIGTQIQYRWNSNSDYKPDGLPVDYGSKDFYTGNVSLRYKFGGEDNIRNMTPSEYFRGLIRWF